MFHLTYEFKLKPTTRQIEIFENWLEQCRRVYNYALALRKHWFQSRSCQINACSIRSEFIIWGRKRSDQLMRANAKA
jgi:putative transposase